MARQVLGIDIGNGRITAVLLAKAFRGGYRVLAVKTGDMTAAETLTANLAAVLGETGRRCAAWASSLPARDLVFRSREFPFAEAGKIRQILPLELEPLLPAPLHDVYLDCLIDTRGGSGRVLAAAAPRALVAERLAAVGGQANGEGILDCQALPAAALLLTRGLLKGGDVLLDIGADATTAVFAAPGRISFVRHYPFGGCNLPAAGEAAERREDTAGSGDPAHLAASFLGELSATMEALKWNEEWEGPLARFLLTGDGALGSPLAAHLQEYFAVPVEGLDLARVTGVTLDEAVRADWEPFLMDGALALALRAAEPGAGGLDFARAAREAGKGRLMGSRTVRWAAALAGGALLLAAADFSLGYHLARLRLERAKGLVTATFKQYCPEVARVVDPVQQLTVKVNEAKRLAAGLAGVRSGVTLIGMLREISQLVPPSIPVVIQSYLYDGDTVTIKGQTQNFEAVNAMKKALEQSRTFKEVGIRSSELGRKDGQVTFEMKLVMR